MCAQRRLRSAWATAQSDQSLRCALIGYLRAQCFFMRTSRLWSDWADAQANLSLGWAHGSFCWFCHAGHDVAAQIIFRCGPIKGTRLKPWQSKTIGPYSKFPVTYSKTYLWYNISHLSQSPEGYLTSLNWRKYMYIWASSWDYGTNHIAGSKLEGDWGEILALME